MTKAELRQAQKELDKVKAHLISKGMQYSLVRRIDDAQAVIDQLLLAGGKKNA